MKKEYLFSSNKQEIPINMDRVYLSRIFTNLITNAKQAEREG
jgi:signal transduction histidine kinase